MLAFDIGPNLVEALKIVLPFLQGGAIVFLCCFMAWVLFR